MKKLVAVFIAFMLVAVLAACKDENSETTQATLILTDVPTLTTNAEQQAVVTQAAADGNGNPTMILTTQRGQVMPTVVTTNFVPDPAAAQLNSSSTAPNFDLTIPTNMTAPVVITANASTTPTTKKQTSTTKPSEEEEEPSTEKPQPKPQYLDVQSIALEGNTLVVGFSPDGWGGSIKKKSPTNVTVTDKESGKTQTATARFGGKDADGHYIIKIDLSAFEGSENVSFSLPAQFIESKNGSVYNAVCPIDVDQLSWSEASEE